MQVTAKANRPQGQFLAMPQKFRAFVAGFGCVHPETRIHTEFGLMRIADIDRPMRVLSWSKKDQKFQLSLSGGSYPKGRENLIRVVTPLGEFVSSGHHRIFSSGHKYRSVEDLRAGEALVASSRSLPLTIEELDLLLSSSNELHSNQTVVDSMARYADAARQYGQQFLMAKGSAQSCAQVSGDAQASDRFVDSFEVSRKDGQPGRLPEHIRRGQSCGHTDMNRSLPQKKTREFSLEGQALASPPERICDYLQGFEQSVLTCERHRTKELRAPACDSSSSSELVLEVEVLQVTEVDESPYYDLQVLDTNNYVDEFGHIHHNSGKTWVGSMAQCLHYWEHPGINQGYFAPTYPQIRDIFYPTIEEVAFQMGQRVEVREGNKEVHFYSGSKYRGTTICRSMERPETIVGFKIGNALVDELDVMKADKAEAAWRKIIARMRYNQDGLRNGIDVTTTPEGFKFTHKMFVVACNDRPELRERYGMIQASTYDNARNLPADYIPSLVETYPDELIDAYLKGQFVNLTSGTVYRNYDRVKCRSFETIQPREALFIGMDFNVQRMAATVYVMRGDTWHSVAELKDILDTPDMIRVIKERWQDHGHRIVVYPDASGGSRKSVDASSSDIALLTQARFEVRAKSKNPAVKDRVLSVNTAFNKGRLFINDKLCPVAARCLEQQAYDTNGEPDKSAGNDHQNDASGYPIAYEMPIHKPVIALPIKFGY